jgi:hypothetical protein
MAIEVRCECGKVLRVAEEHAGKTGRCPACGRPVHVPTPGPEAAPPPPAQPPPGPPRVVPAPEAGASSLPWQDRSRLGFFPALFKTIGAVLFKPGDAFSDMRVEGSLGGSLLYVLILGSVATYIGVGIQFLLQSAFMVAEAPADMPMGVAVFERRLMTFMLVVMPLLVILGSFINAGIVHLFLMLFGGATEGFEGTYLVTAHAQGSTAVLGLVPICGGLIATIWGIVVEIMGLTRVHRTDTWRAALAVLLPVFLCCGGFVAIAFGLWGLGSMAEV